MNAETQFTSLSVNVVNVDDVGYEGGMPGDHRDHPLLITRDMGYRHHQTSLIYQSRAQNGTARNMCPW